MAQAKKNPRLRKAPAAPKAVDEQPEVAAAKTTKRLAKPALLKPVISALAIIFRPIGKVLGWIAPRYFVNSWREVKQVSWPSRRETWRLTLAVFIFATIFGSMVAIVDKGIDQIFKNFVLK